MNQEQSRGKSIRIDLFAARNKLAIFSAGVLALVMAYHVLFGANGVVAYHHKREESRQLQRQIDALQQENKDLQKQIKGLKDDPEAIEKEAREKLKYARPGEVVYTLPSAPASATPALNRK